MCSTCVTSLCQYGPKSEQCFLHRVEFMPWRLWTQHLTVSGRSTHMWEALLTYETATSAVTFISSTNEPETLCSWAKGAQWTWEVADVTQDKEISVWSHKARVQKSAWEHLQRRSRGLLHPANITLGFSSLPVSLNCRILTVPPSEAEPLKSSCVDNLASDSGFTAPQHSLMWQHISSRSRWDVTHSFSSLPCFFFMLWPTHAALWRKRKKKK